MYQGHKNRAHWNVSLWIGNDEALYRLAKRCIKQQPTRAMAAAAFIDTMHDRGITHTPDGLRYTISSVRAAMVGL